MKNTLKVLGIIALVAVIGFSMAACSDDDAGGGGGGSTDSALNGTWVGDEDNGTLTIDGDTFTGTPQYSYAESVASTIAAVQMQVVGLSLQGDDASLEIKDGKITFKSSLIGDKEVYTYKIEGSTLTISEPEDEGGGVAFTGTKQE